MNRPIAYVLLACGVVTLSARCSPAPASTASSMSAGEPHVVDLGHALAETDPTWSGERVFRHTTVARIDKDGYFGGAFSTEEHFGTHLDAPAHFAPEGLTVDRIPADRLVHSAVAIDVSASAQSNEDYRVTVADVQNFERAHGTIEPNTIVAIATGWDARWPDQARYMNVRGNVKHFPGLAVEAAQLLLDRKVAGIVIDTPSVDYGPSEQFEVHHLTMPAGVFHIENATGLVALPASGFSLVVAPIKIHDGSGGPARVFALLNR